MTDTVNNSQTLQGKEQSKRLIELRLALGCRSAKEFFDKYSNGRFSYPQYQKYESGERLLSAKSAILYSLIFKCDPDYLRFGKAPAKKQKDDNEFAALTDEEKEFLRLFRKSKASNSDAQPTAKAE